MVTKDPLEQPCTYKKMKAGGVYDLDESLILITNLCLDLELLGLSCEYICDFTKIFK